MSVMEAVEVPTVEVPAVSAPVAVEPVSGMDIDVVPSAEDDESSKKRKEHPVPEEEALQEASEGRPVRVKYPRLAASVSPGHSPDKTMAELREEARVAREAERRKKEEASALERESKRAALEEVKRQKEEEKQKREEEKKAREEERRKKEEERRKREEERKAKEAEREREKATKEEERKHQRELKEEEKRKKEEERLKKEEEKRKKEEERRKKEEEKEARRKADQDKAQEAVKKQSNLLMSFFKKTPSNTPNTSFIESDKECQNSQTTLDLLLLTGDGANNAQRDHDSTSTTDSSTNHDKTSTSITSTTSTTAPSSMTSASSLSTQTSNLNHQHQQLMMQFQRVGMFLEWVPPQGAIIPRLRRWTSRSSEDSFEHAISPPSSSSPENPNSNNIEPHLRAEFDAWRMTSSSSSSSSLHPPSDRRKSQYSHLPIFQTECSPSVERQKRLMVQHRVKLLHVDGSLRPTYFGTFTAVSPHVSGRRWLGKARDLIDYEVDSEDENFDTIDEAEEEDADDLEAASRGSDDDDGSEEDDNDVDGLGEDDVRHGNEYHFDAFLVPDGHLSEDEENKSDFDDEDDDEDDGDPLMVARKNGGTKQLDEKSRKRQAERAAMLLAQTKKRLSAKPSANASGPRSSQMPTLTGPVFDLKSLEASNVKIFEVFQAHSMKIVVHSDKDKKKDTSTLPFSLSPLTQNNKADNPSGAPRKSTVKLIPPALLPDIAHFIHREWQASFEKLLARVREVFGAQATKKQLGLFIREKCEKTKPPSAKAGVWIVKRAYREALTLPLEDPVPPPTVAEAAITSSTAPLTIASSNPGKATKRTPSKKGGTGQTTAEAANSPSVLQYFSEGSAALPKAEKTSQ